MHKFILIAALCVAFAPVHSTPVPNKRIELSEVAPLELPHGVQEAIIAKLPFKERARLSVLNKNFKHFGDGRKIADDLHANNGKDAIKTAFADGIDNVDVYDALLKTLGPHDGNHANAAQIAGRRGDSQKLDEWTRTYHRLPESAVVGAAESGDFDTFHHAYNQRPGYDEMRLAVTAAASNGHSEFLRRIRTELSNNPEVPVSSMDTYAVDSAAANGQWQTVDDIIAAYPAEHESTIHRKMATVKHAAIQGDMALLQKYLQDGPAYSMVAGQAYSAAAAGGHMDILHYLDANDGQKPNPYLALAEAVEHDQREAFDYIRATHGNLLEVQRQAHAPAIRHNRPEYAQELEWVIRDDNDFYRAAIAAAQRGDIDLFHHYFSRMQQQFDDGPADGLRSALDFGHWGTMDEWARRYPLSQDAVNDALELAAQEGRIDVVLKILKAGLNGVMPNHVVDENGDRTHPTLATAKARLLILSKHRDLRGQFLGLLTPATKLVYADALSDAVAIAQQEEFGADEIEFLDSLEDEFQQYN